VIFFEEKKKSVVGYGVEREKRGYFLPLLLKYE